MRYADARCKITSHGSYYLVEGKDVFTGAPVSVKIPSEELYAYRQGELIQYAMPSLPANEREFLISGIYSPFEDEDEEDYN